MSSIMDLLLAVPSDVFDDLSIIRDGGCLPRSRGRELAAWCREQEEQLRWKHYCSISAKHWKAMSGRQTKTLIEQSGRYGIPFSGAVINLPDVVKALHDFFAENGQAISYAKRGITSKNADAPVFVVKNPTPEHSTSDMMMIVEEACGCVRGLADDLVTKDGAPAGPIVENAVKRLLRNLLAAWTASHLRINGVKTWRKTLHGEV